MMTQGDIFEIRKGIFKGRMERQEANKNARAQRI